MTDNIRAYQQITPTLAEGVYIDPAATVIGDVRLGKDVSIWPQVVIRGDVNSIDIGDYSNIQDGTVVHVSRRTPAKPLGQAVTIGCHVTVGHKAMLHGCRIGDRVLVGMGAIILDGAVIENEVIIGAGAMVTPGKQLASGYLYTGSPARQSRALTAQELAHFMPSADNYVQLKNDYLSTG
jgi:carbonic anhydrase/acetyltransferase-like protein (isoleucine patch superfamily)